MPGSGSMPLLRIWRGTTGAAAKCCGLLMVLFIFLTPSSAQDVTFTATSMQQESCIIVVDQFGTMTTSTDMLTLSSKEAGGVGGLATVTSRKLRQNPGPRFSVTLEAPSTFTSMPVGGDAGVTFQARFSGVNISRGRNFAERNGNRRIRLRRRGTSITQITAHLIATRSTPFPGGTYSAEATLRCE